MPFWQTSPSLHHREHLTAAARALRTLFCFQGSGSSPKRRPNPPPAAALQHPRRGQLRAGCRRGAARGSLGSAGANCAAVRMGDGSVLRGNESHCIGCVCFAFGNSLLTCFLCCSDCVFWVFFFWKVDKWLENVQLCRGKCNVTFSFAACNIVSFNI